MNWIFNGFQDHGGPRKASPLNLEALAAPPARGEPYRHINPTVSLPIPRHNLLILGGSELDRDHREHGRLCILDMSKRHSGAYDFLQLFPPGSSPSRAPCEVVTSLSSLNVLKKISEDKRISTDTMIFIGDSSGNLFSIVVTEQDHYGYYYAQSVENLGPPIKHIIPVNPHEGLAITENGVVVAFTTEMPKREIQFNRSGQTLPGIFGTAGHISPGILVACSAEVTSAEEFKLYVTAVSHKRGEKLEISAHFPQREVLPFQGQFSFCSVLADGILVGHQEGENLILSFVRIEDKSEKVTRFAIGNETTFLILNRRYDLESLTQVKQNLALCRSPIKGVLFQAGGDMFHVSAHNEFDVRNLGSRRAISPLVQIGDQEFLPLQSDLRSPVELTGEFGRESGITRII